MDVDNIDNPKAKGSRLRLLRLALGISEANAAKVFGVTLRTYRRYETGQSKPRSMKGEIAFLHFCRVSCLGWLYAAECYESISRTGTKIAILGLQNARLRHADIARSICRLLPSDRKNAEAVLNDVRKIMEIELRHAERGKIVALPNSST